MNHPDKSSSMPVEGLGVRQSSAASMPAAWEEVADYVSNARKALKLGVAFQAMAGIRLDSLKKTWGVRKGGARQGTGPRPRGYSKPQNVALNSQSTSGTPLSWAEACTRYLGISDQTAARWIEMGRAALAHLAKGRKEGNAGAGTSAIAAILAKDFMAITPAELEVLGCAVERISDGTTQLEFLQLCGVTKPMRLTSAMGTPIKPNKKGEIPKNIDPDTGLRIHTPSEKDAVALHETRMRAERGHLEKTICDLSTLIEKEAHKRLNDADVDLFYGLLCDCCEKIRKDVLEPRKAAKAQARLARSLNHPALFLNAEGANAA